jgi:2-amino-4-hydroxy-6-hydroxymethyldihydropteridine diphosphokinase
MTTCLVGLGSNLGDRQQTLDRAVELLRETPNVLVAAVSAWRPTQPIGGSAGQGEYLNGALLLETTLEPDALLGRLRQIEQQLGRARGERWEPRTLDLDLLLFGDAVLDTPSLVLPHPRMAFRRFVVEPAAEIAPDLPHPTIGWSLARLRDHLQTALPYVAIAGPLPAPKAWLAEEVVRQLSGRLVREPFSLGRETPESGPGSRTEIPFLTQATWALTPEFWDGGIDTLRVSDFWFDECLIFAEATLPPAEFQRFRDQWQASREQITPPKLLVVLDAEVENVHEETAKENLSEEQPWRRAALFDEADGVRQAILDRAKQPGQGPVLRLLAADLSAAAEETVAAIQAMQGDDVRPLPESSSQEPELQLDPISPPEAVSHPEPILRREPGPQTDRAPNE